jgi:hypothetical protein
MIDDFFDSQSEDWQESDEGIAYEEWRDAWADEPTMGIAEDVETEYPHQPEG